jgi:hypothetical protein
MFQNIFDNFFFPKLKVHGSFQMKIWSSKKLHIRQNVTLLNPAKLPPAFAIALPSFLNSDLWVPLAVVKFIENMLQSHYRKAEWV